MTKLNLQRGDTLLVNGQAVAIATYHRANHMTLQGLPGVTLGKLDAAQTGWTPEPREPIAPDVADRVPLDDPRDVQPWNSDDAAYIAARV